MDFEGLEQVRAETTKKVMEAMTEIATDKEADLEWRIGAAKVVDAMSDSIIKARIMTEQNQTLDKTSDTLTKQIKDLDK